ncbi:MAG: CRISPR-associated endonuclease Cas2 [Mycoplasma sp.]|nr:CRISPR-associated endonuclease Cas2 [Mycoplasma sp.]
MNIYMKIILMYDLNMDDKEKVKAYQKFHKWITKRGYIMMQYSLYYKTINAFTKYDYEKKALAKNVPTSGNIRCLLITDRQFYDMEILCGLRYVSEKINNTERYIKIDENIWE